MYSRFKKSRHYPMTGFFTLFIVFFLMPGMAPASESTKSALILRPPAVAGSFYPNSPTVLRQTVTALLESSSGESVKKEVRALISPHAGYRYSGVVAAAGYKQINLDTKRVILLGPSHRVSIKGPSIAAVCGYETPLGSVALDDIADFLRRSTLFNFYPAAHRNEHSLEVQLPFLQVRLGAFTVIPILTNNTPPEQLAAALLPYVDQETLIVASSDLSHYHPYRHAAAIDRQCIDAIMAMDPSAVTTCEACGKQAILTLMHLARTRGWSPRLIDYKNSGDTGGGKDRVVGYASIAFLGGKERATPMERNGLSHEEKMGLLKLARSAIEANLIQGTRVIRPEIPTPALLEDRGCFVTLHKHEQLRGCIGSIEPVSTLMACIEQHALSAAFHDPRFPPVTADELDAIDIEVSVLTVPEALTFKDGEDLKNKLETEIHGVILSSGLRKSTFLPQVWKQLPDKEAFLEHLCLKGGMSGDAWQNPQTKVEVYKAIAFGEKDPEMSSIGRSS